MLKVHAQITKQLSDRGYEMGDLLGRPYDPGMKVIGTSIEDDTLAEGETVITRIIKPQVSYRGKMVQAAQVEISKGTRPLTAEEQQKRDAEGKRKADRLKAAEEKLRTKPEVAESEVNREALRPSVQELSDQVESIPDGSRGKKQLRGVVKRLVAVLDAEAKSGKTNDGTSYDENALAVADELVRLEQNLAHGAASDTSGFKQLEASARQIRETLEANGYEVVEHLGRRFKSGLKVIATFREDDTLSEGEEVITRVRKPQVNYGGQMVQAAEVVVSQGTRIRPEAKPAEEKATPETQKKRTVTATTPHGTFTTRTAKPRSHVLLGRVTRHGQERWVKASWIGRPELVADRIAAYSSDYAEVKAFPVDEQPKPKPRARKQQDPPWNYEDGLPPSAPANTENEENIGLGRLLTEVEVGHGQYVDAVVYDEHEVARSEAAPIGGVAERGYPVAASQAFHAINNHIDLAIEQDTTGILAPGKRKNKKTGEMEQTGYTHPTQDEVIEALTEYLTGRRFRPDQKVKHRIVAAAKLVVEAGDSGYANAGTAKSTSRMPGEMGLAAGADRLAELRGDKVEKVEEEPDWVAISDEDAEVIASALSEDWIKFAEYDPAMRGELARALAGTTRRIDDVRSAVEAQFLEVYNEVRQRTAAPIWAEATAIKTDLTREQNPLDPEDVLAVLFSQRYIARGKRTTASQIPTFRSSGVIVYGPLEAVNVAGEARASLESDEIDSNIRQFKEDGDESGPLTTQDQPRASDVDTDTGDLLDRITPGSFLESVLLFMQRGRAFWSGEKVAGVDILDKGRLARARTETLRQYWIRADFEAGRKLKRPGDQRRADSEVISKARSVFSDIAGLKGLKDAAIENLTPKQRGSLMAQIRRAVEKARLQLLIQDHVQEGVAGQLLSPSDPGKAMTKGQLYGKFKSWADKAKWSQEALKAFKEANAAIPDEAAQAKWWGLLNLEIMRLAPERALSPADVSEFVREVIVDDDASAQWDDEADQHVRHHLVRTFMALDMRLDYSDLTVKVTKHVPGTEGRNVRAEFVNVSSLRASQWEQGETRDGKKVTRNRREEFEAPELKDAERLLYLSQDSPHTVAHEIGHYLDAKLGQELTGLPVSLSTVRESALKERLDNGLISEERYRFGLRFLEFVRQAYERTDTSDAYRSRPEEVFARFVEWFVYRSEVMAYGEGNVPQVGVAWEYEKGKEDSFSDGDFFSFVKLLQDMELNNAMDGNPYGELAAARPKWSDIEKDVTEAATWVFQLSPIRHGGRRRQWAQRFLNLLTQGGTPQSIIAQVRERLDDLYDDVRFGGIRAEQDRALLRDHAREVPLEWVQGPGGTRRLQVSTRWPHGKDRETPSGIISSTLSEADDPKAQSWKKAAAALLKAMPKTAPGEKKRDPEAHIGYLLTEAQRKLTDPDAIIEAAVEAMTANLQTIWDSYDQTWRDRAKSWYYGASAIAARIASGYHLTHEQASALIATLSPQTDWNENVRRAEVIAEYTRRFQAAPNSVFTEELAERWAASERSTIDESAKRKLKKELRGKRTNAEKAQATENVDLWVRWQYALVAKRVAALSDRTWADLDVDDRARFIRASYDTENPSKPYSLYTPEGDRTGVVQENMGWGSYEEIAKGVSIILDGSPASISWNLGTGHKIRNFFNNISNPAGSNSVTIDTQAVAAALLQPVGISSDIMKNVFSTGPSVGSLGFEGLSTIVAEAYRRAANANDVRPHEMQSVTWTASRGLFEYAEKTAAAPKAEHAWWKHSHRTVQEGATLEADAKEISEKIRRIAGGYNAPAWADGEIGDTGHQDRLLTDAERGQSDRRGLSALSGSPGRGAEVVAGQAADQVLGPVIDVVTDDDVTLPARLKVPTRLESIASGEAKAAIARMNATVAQTAPESQYDEVLLAPVFYSALLNYVMGEGDGRSQLPTRRREIIEANNVAEGARKLPHGRLRWRRKGVPRLQSGELLRQLKQENNGIKPADLKWSGIENWLNTNFAPGQEVTQAQVVAFLQESRLAFVDLWGSNLSFAGGGELVQAAGVTAISAAEDAPLLDQTDPDATEGAVRHPDDTSPEVQSWAEKAGMGVIPFGATAEARRTGILATPGEDKGQVVEAGEAARQAVKTGQVTTSLYYGHPLWGPAGSRGTYVLPGGESYAEYLLVFPQLEQVGLHKDADEKVVLTPSPGTLPYRGPHFNSDDVVMHVRLSTRREVTYTRLTLEEIAQAVMSKGLTTEQFGGPRFSDVREAFDLAVSSSDGDAVGALLNVEVLDGLAYDRVDLVIDDWVSEKVITSLQADQLKHAREIVKLQDGSVGTATGTLTASAQEMGLKYRNLTPSEIRSSVIQGRFDENEARRVLLKPDEAFGGATQRVVHIEEIQSDLHQEARKVAQRRVRNEVKEFHDAILAVTGGADLVRNSLRSTFGWDPDTGKIPKRGEVDVEKLWNGVLESLRQAGLESVTPSDEESVAGRSLLGKTALRTILYDRQLRQWWESVFNHRFGIGSWSPELRRQLAWNLAMDRFAETGDASKYVAPWGGMDTLGYATLDTELFDSVKEAQAELQRRQDDIAALEWATPQGPVVPGSEDSRDSNATFRLDIKIVADWLRELEGSEELDSPSEGETPREEMSRDEALEMGMGRDEERMRASRGEIEIDADSDTAILLRMLRHFIKAQAGHVGARLEAQGHMARTAQGVIDALRAMLDGQVEIRSPDGWESELYLGLTKDGVTREEATASASGPPSDYAQQQILAGLTRFESKWESHLSSTGRFLIDLSSPVAKEIIEDDWTEGSVEDFGLYADRIQSAFNNKAALDRVKSLFLFGDTTGSEGADFPRKMGPRAGEIFKEGGVLGVIEDMLSRRLDVWMRSAKTDRDSLFRDRSSDPEYGVGDLQRVPNVPFEQSRDWAMRGFKRILRLATELGAKRVTWSTGQQLADIFGNGLGHAVHRIYWSREESPADRPPDGSQVDESPLEYQAYDISEVPGQEIIVVTLETGPYDTPAGTGIPITAAPETKLRVSPDGAILDTGGIGGVVQGQPLEKVVGGEIAKRILSSEGADNLWVDELLTPRLRGLETFYDSGFPGLVEAYLNDEWGDPSKQAKKDRRDARSGAATRPAGEREIRVESLGFESMNVSDDGGVVDRGTPEEAASQIKTGRRSPTGYVTPSKSAEIQKNVAALRRERARNVAALRSEGKEPGRMNWRAIQNEESRTVHGVEITEDMRETVLYRGQPQFAKGQEISVTEIRRMAQEQHLPEADLRRLYKQRGYTITDPSSAPLLPGMSEVPAPSPELVLEGEQTEAVGPTETEPGLDLGPVDYDAIAERRRKERREARRAERKDQEDRLLEEAKRRQSLIGDRLFDEEKAAEPLGIEPAGSQASLFDEMSDEVKEFYQEKMRAPELPELLRFLRSLAPEVVVGIRKRLGSGSGGGKVMGRFRSGSERRDPRIELLAGLFDDPDKLEDAAKVLAHEIGHLVDWLPEGVIERGTMVSHLLKLHGEAPGIDGKRTSFMHRVMQVGGLEYKEADLKAELKKWTMAWNPFNERADDAYTKYRYSQAELYAEALSGILSDPKQFKEIAPSFYRAFFDAMNPGMGPYKAGRGRRKGEYLLTDEQRAEVVDIFQSFQSLQAELRGMEPKLFAQTLFDITGAFREGQQKAEKLLDNLRTMEAVDYQRIIPHLWEQIVDKNIPVIRLVDQAEREGRVIPDGSDPRTLLSGRNYISGRTTAVLTKHFQPIMEEIRSSGMGEVLRQVTASSRDESGEQATPLDDGWHVFGLAVFFERIIEGDRSEFANPFGIGVKRATAQYKALKKLMEATDDANGVDKLSPRRMTNILSRSLEAYRAAVDPIVEEGYERGLYTEDMYNKMKENSAYAPFRVIEHMENAMTAAVHEQVGTFKAITNPADAGILKTLVTIQAGEINNIKHKTIDFLRSAAGASAFIREAPLVKVRKGLGKDAPIVSEPAEPRGVDRQKWTLVRYLDQGKPVGVWVSKEIGYSLNNASVETNSLVLKVMTKANNAWFRPVFTTYNLGFQGYNFVRDAGRFWIAMSHRGKSVSIPKMLVLYFRSLPMAVIRGFGLKNRPGRSKAFVKAYEEVMETAEGKIIGQTLSDYIRGYGPEDAAIERMLEEASGTKDPKKQSEWLSWENWKLARFFKSVGDTIESLPKFAAIKHMQNPRWFGGETRAIKDLTEKERAFVRDRVGSPDFLAGGYYKPWSNNIFLFSNAILQGWRADVKTVLLDDETRMGAQWKLVRTSILPALMVFAASEGWFGPDEDDEDDAADVEDRLFGMGQFGLIGLILAGVPGGLVGAAAGGVKPRMAAQYRSQLKEFYRSIPQYELRNYIPIPVSYSEATEEVGVLRIPMPDTSRVIHGITWIALQAAKNRDNRASRELMELAQEVGAYTFGQAPSVFPGLTALKDNLTILGGGNPYSPFLGRKVLTQSQERMPYLDRLKSLRGYTLRQLGFGMLMGKYGIPGVAPTPKERMPVRERGWLQMVLEAPGGYHTFGRFFRWTRWGKREARARDEQMLGEATAQAAATRRAETFGSGRTLLKMIDEGFSVPRGSREFEGEVDRIHDASYGALPGTTPADNAERGRRKGVIRDRLSQFLDVHHPAMQGLGFSEDFQSILNLRGTNYTRMVILRGLKEDMGDETWDQFYELLKEGPFSNEPLLSDNLMGLLDANMDTPVATLRENVREGGG